MIIAISGLTGCGKNTLGELLAKKFGYRLICPTFKDLADKEGMSLMDFQKKAAKNFDIDKKFDEVLKEMTSGGNCVVTTWLGPWMVEADIKIKLFAPDEIRAERIGKRDKMSKTQALGHLKERDDENWRRYKKVYGIDIYNYDIFDICLNSAKYTPEELCKIVEHIVKVNGREK